MAQTSHRSKRKPTGGKYVGFRKKRVFEIRNAPALTKLGERVKRMRRVIGGNKKQFLLSEKSANVYDPKSKKTKKVEIKNILENEANRHFVRRNIITKGAVIETELGKAKVTSRPGQEGAINAILV